VTQMKLVKIVTHHENPDKAAELFAEERVVAVGYADLGDFRKLSRDEIKRKSQKVWKRSEHESAKDASQLAMFRDEVKNGDIVFAYKGNNEVALVGQIVGPHKYNTKNKVGDPKGEIGYPNQRKVKWWDSPRNFDRSFLPKELSEWVARPGTISVREYNIKKLKKALQEIPGEETITRALEIQSEDEIKDYIQKHPGDLEEGLLIVKREYPTSRGPMDFLAKDKNGIHTVIEVKTKAGDTTATQTRRYMRAYEKEKKRKVANIRGIIVAEEFTPNCLEDVADLVRHGFDLRLYKCRKKFHFESKSGFE